MAPSTKTYFDKVISQDIYRKLYSDADADATGFPSGSRWSTRELIRNQVICRNDKILPSLSVRSHPTKSKPSLPDIPDNVKLVLETPTVDVPNNRKVTETDIFHALQGHSMSVFWGALNHYDSAATKRSDEDSHGQTGGRLQSPFSSWTQQDVSSPLSSPPSGDEIADLEDDNVEDNVEETGGRHDDGEDNQTTPEPLRGTKRRANLLGSSPTSSPPSATSGAELPNMSWRSRRLRKRPALAASIDSTAMILSSPSSNEVSSSESSQASAGYIDQRTVIEAGRDNSEDQTAHLLQSFIRPILHMIQPSRDLKKLIEIDVGKHRYESVFRGSSYAAVDDGGLTRRDFGSRRVPSRMVMIETKRNIQSSDAGRRILSDDQLGQMVAEALAARLEARKEEDHPLYSQPSIMMISGMQQYVQLLEIVIPGEFIRASQNGQKLDRYNDEHFITVTATKVMDLSRMEDRTNMARYLMALVSWATRNSRDQ